MSNQAEIYKGWRIGFNASRPVTGLYKAERFGVGLCAGTRHDLERMIMAKNNEAFERNQAAGLF